MLEALTLILACQLIGEVTVLVSGLPVPGPVLGMLLLLAWLFLRGTVSDGVERTADTLLGHLSLLFVPAGVGIVVLLGELRDDWLPISLGLWGSWLVGLLVTGWVVTALIRVFERERGEGS